ncbi:MAG: hypothetical protein M3N53_09305 [Actinomycetota bacterium]|nr:hypothetical protein [Actinomycetota bacterium]
MSDRGASIIAAALVVAAVIVGLGLRAVASEIDDFSRIGIYQVELVNQ